jgi:L-threonylcarbamoyladenylate synthase
MAEPVIVSAAAPDALDRAVAALDAGSIVGLPTETVYGVAVLPAEGPLATVIAAKERTPEKGIAVLVDDPSQVEDLVVMPVEATRLAQRFWPGALTLVLELRNGVDLPPALTGGTRRLGVRLPDHPVPRAIARVLGPIAVTSANRSGKPEALDAGALREQLGGAIALILDGGPVAGTGTPSTVVAIDPAGGVSVLRAGALDPERIRLVASGSGG